VYDDEMMVGGVLSRSTNRLDDMDRIPGIEANLDCRHSAKGADLWVPTSKRCMSFSVIAALPDKTLQHLGT
jgi:hypothetical protein